MVDESRTETADRSYNSKVPDRLPKWYVERAVELVMMLHTRTTINNCSGCLEGVFLFFCCASGCLLFLVLGLALFYVAVLFLQLIQ